MGVDGACHAVAPAIADPVATFEPLGPIVEHTPVIHAALAATAPHGLAAISIRGARRLSRSVVAAAVGRWMGAVPRAAETAPQRDETR